MNEQNESMPNGFFNIPAEMRGKIFEDLLSLGSFSIPSLEFVSDFATHSHDDEGSGISVYFRVAIYQINFFSAEDPLQLHYAVAREVLKEAGGSELEADERARDLLARELVKECKAFAIKIIPIVFLQENNEDRSLFVITQKDERAQHLACEIEGRLWLDELFLKHLGGIGKAGEKRAETISIASTKWMCEFRDNKKASRLFRIWVDIERPPYNCRFLKILAEILWEERIERLVKRAKNNVPALTQRVHPSVVKMLSPRAETIKMDSKIQVVLEGKVIATIPTMASGLLSVVTKGAGSLNSLYHHRLIRFECRRGFENWASGREDIRLLKFERGFSEIAEKMGLTSCRAVEEIKNILHAQAHMHFHFEDGSSGNLIVLSKFHSKGCGRDDGVSITLGPQLLPYYTFQESKKEKLLIPVPELPPLVSSYNSHAAQAALQMLVIEVFANKSVELFETGVVEIEPNTWNELAKASGLSVSTFKQTLDRWVNDGTDGPQFLIHRGGYGYSFGPAYQKEEAFLKEQGALRKKRRADGKKSAQARKRKSRG